MSDEQQSSQPQRRTTDDDRNAWNAYWQGQGMPWRTEPEPGRTEPEIDQARQAYLAKRRDTIQPDVQQGAYPFKDVEPKLTRADVEWLLATHESRDVRGPVVWEEEIEKPEEERRAGLDLRGTDLRKVDLHELPLTFLRASLDVVEWSSATEEQRTAASAHLEGSILDGAHLETLYVNPLWTGAGGGSSPSTSHLAARPLCTSSRRSESAVRLPAAPSSRLACAGAACFLRPFLCATLPCWRPLLVTCYKHPHESRRSHASRSAGLATVARRWWSAHRTWRRRRRS